MFYDNIKLLYYNIEHPTGVTKNSKLKENLFLTIRVLYLSKGIHYVGSFRDIDGTLQLLLDSNAIKIDSTKNIYQLCKTLNSIPCKFCSSKTTVRAIEDGSYSIHYCRYCNQAFKKDLIVWKINK